MMSPTDRAAAKLLELAEQARRLPPPDRMHPEAFHEARDELGAALIELSRQLSGRVDPLPPRRARRPLVSTTTERIGGRLVMVQVRRGSFALG